MKNLSMLELIKSGECLDVRQIGELFEKDQDGLVFLLRNFIPNHGRYHQDYADVETESWIGSIGENRKTGSIFAATDSRFYQKPGYTCLFLR